MAELRWATGTHEGQVREINEDAAFANPYLFVVADGMGGHLAGEVASAMAIEILNEELDNGGANSLDDLVAAISLANARIFADATDNPAHAGMGTTITAIAVVHDRYDGEALGVANVGDSRIYLYRHNRIRQVTIDHSFVQELIAEGAISAVEARHHPRRNIVTRGLGIESSVRVDSWTLPLIRGDRFVLCSDGLSDYVIEEDVAQILEEHSEDPAAAVIELINRANAAGGPDNITVVIVDVLAGEEPPDATEEIDVVPEWFDEDLDDTEDTLIIATDLPPDPDDVGGQSDDLAGDDDITPESVAIGFDVGDSGERAEPNAFAPPMVDAGDASTAQVAGDHATDGHANDDQAKDAQVAGDQTNDDRVGGDWVNVDSVNGDLVNGELAHSDSQDDHTNGRADDTGEVDTEGGGGGGSDQETTATDPAAKSSRKQRKAAKRSHGEKPKKSTSRGSRILQLVLLIGLAAVIIGGGAVLAGWARGAYFVAFDDAGVVTVYQGRKGGFLWFQPTAEATGEWTRDELTVESVQKVEQEPTFATLANANRFVTDQLSPKAELDESSTTDDASSDSGTSSDSGDGPSSSTWPRSDTDNAGTSSTGAGG